METLQEMHVELENRKHENNGKREIREHRGLFQKFIPICIKKFWKIFKFFFDKDAHTGLFEIWKRNAEIKLTTIIRSLIIFALLPLSCISARTAVKQHWWKDYRFCRITITCLQRFPSLLLNWTFMPKIYHLL